VGPRKAAFPETWSWSTGTPIIRIIMARRPYQCRLSRFQVRSLCSEAPWSASVLSRVAGRLKRPC